MNPSVHHGEDYSGDGWSVNEDGVPVFHPPHIYGERAVYAAVGRRSRSVVPAVERPAVWSGSERLHKAAVKRRRKRKRGGKK